MVLKTAMSKTELRDLLKQMEGVLVLHEDEWHVIKGSEQRALELATRIPGLLAHIRTLDGELENQRDTAERFVKHATSIWNVAFPDDPDGWEYGTQLERSVSHLIAEMRAALGAQRAESHRLRDALLTLATHMGGESKAKLAKAPLPGDPLSHPKAWCLIARDDVQCALNLLALVRAGSVEAIAGICDTAIYVLETGVHEARAVPADFQIGSITIHTADGVQVESIRDDGTITFTRPPSSGGIQVSEDIPEDEGDDDD